ncbi:MAG: orotidine-5'-phosphate decarboxylase [Candidatus Saelkia tenebricola]|nr:orotidine-5'-phosphate decarboxylase [Candidatus Saelkia tenebricola]
MKRSNNIIVALDVAKWKDVKFFLDIFSPHVKTFKIGPRLFIPYGKKIIRLIKSYNCDVFLDLKLHDIPTQVANSVKEIADLGVSMFTVHALGGESMIRKAREVLDTFPVKERSCMLAVTVLTSISEKDLHFLGFKNKINIIVFKLANLALTSGADGIVCSVKDVQNLKEKVNKDFVAVVPGISLTEMHEDQKRCGSPKEAFDNGADYIVVGRSILEAQDPLKVLKEVKI